MANTAFGTVRLFHNAVVRLAFGTKETTGFSRRLISFLDTQRRPTTNNRDLTVFKRFISETSDSMASGGSSGARSGREKGAPPRPRGGIAPPLEQKARDDQLSSPTAEYIGIIQLSCTDDKEQNREEATQLIEECAMKGAKMVFLPEAFDYIANDTMQAAQLAESLDGPTMTHYLQLAKNLKIWLSLGGFHEKMSELRDDGVPWMTNTHVLINDAGSIVSTYRKIHLFENGGETKQTVPGIFVEAPVISPIGNIGLGICYDVRFPEFSMALRCKGAQILTYPSAFTVATGKAHWESLIRARAIETQCYVIAAAQTGVHNKGGRESYGHSMVVDPWGKPYYLKDAKGSPTNVGYLIVEVDPNICTETRKKMPVFEHRRPHAYYGALPAPLTSNMVKPGGNYSMPPPEEGNTKFNFGSMQLDKKNVFVESPLARAFVNRKCVVPGHVLVIPRREAIRLFDLTSNETRDLFDLVRLVQKVLEEIHKVSSSTVSIQDGPDAGQTVKHVHVHVLPRRPLDIIPGDTVYSELEKHDKQTKGDRGLKYRAPQDMFEEAMAIRAHILAHHMYKMEAKAAGADYGGIDKTKWPFAPSRKCSK